MSYDNESLLQRLNHGNEELGNHFFGYEGEINRLAKHTWVNWGFTLTTRYSKCVKGYLRLLPRSPGIWLRLKKLTGAFVSTGGH